jgi:hypothetical protein
METESNPYAHLSRREAKKLLKVMKAEQRKLNIELRRHEEKLAELEEEYQAALSAFVQAAAEGKVNQAEFYEHAMKPDFPDSMNFELKTEDPNSTFSMEGYQSIADQIRIFMMGRVYAHGMPNHMRVEVNLAFEIDGVWTRRTVDLEFAGPPWFAIADPNEMTRIDGKHRLAAYRPVDKP